MNTSKAVRSFLKRMDLKKRVEIANEIHTVISKLSIAVFNFSLPEHRDFKRCWALKNLQPLWASENCKKKDSLQKHFQPSLQL